MKDTTQPHWIAPLITITPLLTQLFRYDQFSGYETNQKATF
jgi:hypothetical protein